MERKVITVFPFYVNKLFSFKVCTCIESSHNYSGDMRVKDEESNATSIFDLATIAKTT